LASLISTRGMAANATPPKARNVVLVHGLFADGSCWSEVIARLQMGGLNVTSVQNPLTTLPEAVASAERVLARQDGPTVLVGHSFSGMDRHGGRRAFEGFGAGLCGGARAGCRRRLHGLG
jgi:pimeloyl-ACP methyl ester carboxylesterase